ncbi:MAG: type II secretion system F family protein [Patescibacteria group bacterium]|nr:type II secretion system F family protein [Patescibacteria group bacterium]
MMRKIRAWMARARPAWRQRDKAMLIERLGMYIGAGLPVDRALLAAADGAPARQEDSLKRAAAAAGSGQPFWKAIDREARLPASVRGIVSCGEASGGLASALASAASVMERSADMKSKCLSAMAYPAVIACATVAISIGLMRGVMPQIEPLLKGIGSGLPPLTVAVMAASDLLASYWGYGLSATAALAAVLWYGHRFTPVRAAIQRALALVPLVGPAAHAYSASAMARSLGALMASGMPVDAAYGEAIGAVPLLKLRRSLEAKKEGVSRGEPLNAALKPALPAYASSIVAAGEMSGDVAAALVRAADIMDKELDRSLKRAASLIEPLMMMAMGTAVGTVALSIMMPIYDMSKALQH